MNSKKGKTGIRRSVESAYKKPFKKDKEHEIHSEKGLTN